MAAGDFSNQMPNLAPNRVPNRVPNGASSHGAPGPTQGATVAPAETLVIGAGPAGLMAAEVLAAAGRTVVVYDAMPSAGRKFLLAGIGGLNLTHSEPMARFVSRYGAEGEHLAPLLAAFGADELRAWAKELGVQTFVGTSGRVFPQEMKAAPLLRAWLHRLRRQGVQFHMRQRWRGWCAGADADLGGGGAAALPPGAAPSGEHRLRFAGPDGPHTVQARQVVLALGGASWPQLGSDAAWVPWLQQAGVAITSLAPANCGFDVAGRHGDGWTPHFRERFAGQPFKAVGLRCGGAAGGDFSARGEFVATASGIEGSLVYAAARTLREEWATQRDATAWLDLLPQWDAARVLAEVAHPRGSQSLAKHLKSRLRIDGIKMGILHELLTPAQLADARTLAAAIKALPLRLLRPRPLAETISTAGGVAWSGLDAHLMLRAVPGVFCAGEMLDWEAPTGGYLLTACFATGRAAGLGALRRAQALAQPFAGTRNQLPDFG